MQVTVIGAGIAGLSVAYELQRRGADVQVLTADPPGQVQSIGRSRIFRLTHTDPALAELAVTAQQGWERWERETSARLLDRTGRLMTGTGGQTDGCLHPLSHLDTGWEIDSNGAVIDAAATISLLSTRLNIRQARVERLDGSTVVTADGERINADAVVVCAGPATYALLDLPPARAFRCIRFSFRASVKAPCWIHRGPEPVESFYALADGPHHYAVGLSEAATAEIAEDEAVAAESERVEAIVARLMPVLDPSPVAERTISRIFPHAPATASLSQSHDGYDLIGAGRAVGLTGPNLFKFAPVLGGLVADRLGVGAAD